MKTTKKTTDDLISEAIENNGAFFAFSDKQFEESQKPNTKYMNMGAGLICPSNNAMKLKNEIDAIIKNKIQKELQEHTPEYIIEKTLCDYECYYTGDVSDAVDSLKANNITREQIEKIYFKTKEKHYND